MAKHGPFKTRTNAKEYASKMRKKGFVAAIDRSSSGKVYVYLRRK